MRVFVALLLVLTPVAVYGADRGVTTPVKSVQPAESKGRLVSGIPPISQEPGETYSAQGKNGISWILIDSMKVHKLIPPGQSFAACFDYSDKVLRDTLLSDPLTAQAKLALEKAPDWLKLDLNDNFRRMDAAHQDEYADLILNCPDKRYYDEVCFQIAHLSPQTLTYGAFDSNLLVENVYWMYEIDKDLGYVSIVDYGDPDLGGGYYSTTSYKYLNQFGDTVEEEIPSEIYYWWVVSPKVSDELPRMDASVYDYFWREYVYTQADSGYPLLDTALTYAQVVWDERQRDLPPGRPFADSCTALDIVGNWVSYTVPYAASGNRPIQPNVIAHEHNGNCGELQDLLCAAARTALVPTLCVCDINEDHVWDAFRWAGDWHPYQVDLGFGGTHINNPGIAYDKDKGGSKDCSAIWNWRMDGYQWSDIERYSKSCTLTVIVQDKNGRPVDGAVVKLLSEMWPEYQTSLWPCFNGATDRYGIFTTVLGDHQNYFAAIESPMGYTAAEKLIDSTEAIPGKHIYWVRNLDGEMPVTGVHPDSMPANPSKDYMMEAYFQIVDETVYGIDCYNDFYNNQWAYKLYPGKLDLFLTDETNFGRLVDSLDFDSYVIQRKLNNGSAWLTLPTNEDYFFVFSNSEQIGLTQSVYVTVYLYRNSQVAVADAGFDAAMSDTRMSVWPNPFNESSVISISGPEFAHADGPIRIFDTSGRLVRKLAADNAVGSRHCIQAKWDGRDSGGRPVADGVYFCCFSGGGRTLDAKVVKVR
jgi:hypothetical protein